jgi:hypothetical protein
MKFDGTTWHSASNGLGPGTIIRGLQVMTLTSYHAKNSLMAQDKTLLLTGQLNLSDFGNASAALFNGTTFYPFILSMKANSAGSISQIFSAKSNFLTGGRESNPFPCSNYSLIKTNPL